MRRSRRRYSQAQTDAIVVREADDDSGWTDAIRVKPPTAVTIRMTPLLIQKAKVMARRRKMKAYQDFLLEIINERIGSAKLSKSSSQKQRRRKVAG